MILTTGDEKEFDLSDLFDDESIESIEAKADMQRFIDALARLNKRYAEILYMRMYGYTLDEIAEEHKLTKGRVCQILSRIKQMHSETA